MLTRLGNRVGRALAWKPIRVPPSAVSLILCAALVGCASPRETPAGSAEAVAVDAAAAEPLPLTGPAELRIEVHENGVGVIYEYERLLERLRQDAGGAVRLRLDEGDVRRFVVGPPPSPMLALHLTPPASKRWRSALPAFSETHPVVVSLRGKHMFSAVLYPAVGAAAIQSPVVHASEVGGCVVLTIGAQQGTAYFGGAPVEDARRIDRVELRELFRRRGVLEEQSEPPRPLGRER